MPRSAPAKPAGKYRHQPDGPEREYRRLRVPHLRRGCGAGDADLRPQSSPDAGGGLHAGAGQFPAGHGRQPPYRLIPGAAHPYAETKRKKNVPFSLKFSSDLPIRLFTASYRFTCQREKPSSRRNDTDRGCSGHFPSRPSRNTRGGLGLWAGMPPPARTPAPFLAKAARQWHTAAHVSAHASQRQRASFRPSVFASAGTDACGRHAATARAR